MYSQTSAKQISHNSDLYIPQEEQLELPAIFTPQDDTAVSELLGLPHGLEQDHEQMLSQQLRTTSGPRLRMVSMPTPFADPSFLASPISQDDGSEADLSLSPAAMFLSSFSPSVPSQPLPDAEGETVCGYTLGPIIAYGGFSVIRRASSAQGEFVAVKIVRHSDVTTHEDPERARKHLEHEATVWSSLCHENILPLFTSAHTPYADFFITLYCPAGSLFDILKRDGRPGLPPDEAGRVFRQVVKGLRYLHEVAGYVHGDMKLENVLVDETGVCRITDFGMARKIGDCETSSDDEDDRPPSHNSRAGGALRPSQSVRQMKRPRSKQPLAAGPLSSHLSLLRHHSGPRHRNSSPLPAAAAPPMANQVFQPGSLPYASPELLLPSSSAAPYRPHPAQDIWALGVMLYLLLSGRLPFADSFEPRLQMKILHGAYDLPQGIARAAERVLVGCLQRSVQDRWTITAIDQVIEWGESDDAAEDAPAPTGALSRRSLSHNPPTVHENVVLDDVEPSHPQAIPERGTSRSRSSRSRSRPSYHPYLHDPHANPQSLHEPPQPSLSGLNSAILRSISSSSSDSAGSAAPFTRSISSASKERGRPARPATISAIRSVSRSGSPPETPLTPIDISAAYTARGRKPSPRTIRVPNSSPRVSTSRSHAPEDESLPLPPRWAMSPDSVDDATGEANSRSASYDDYTNPHGLLRRLSVDRARQSARSGSLPPKPLPGVSWTLQGFKTSSTSGSTPVLAHGQLSAARSRSVDFRSEPESLPPSRGRQRS